MIITKTKDHIHIKNGTHRHVLNHEYSIINIDGDTEVISASNVDGEHPIVKDLFNAIGAVVRSDAKVEFDTDTPVVIIDGVEVSPGDAVSSMNADAQAFHNAVYIFDNGRFAEIYRLEQLNDIPEMHETKEVQVEELQVVDRVPSFVMVTREQIVTEKVEIMRDGKGTGEFMELPVIKTAAVPVSEGDKARLKELRATELA